MNQPNVKTMLLDEKESDELFKRLMAKRVIFIPLYNPKTDKIALLIKGDFALKDSDGGITWSVNLQSVNGHIFLILTTGDKTKRTITIPFCFNSRTMDFIKVLVNHTYDDKLGKLGIKPVTILLGHICDTWEEQLTDKGFEISVDLSLLVMNYFMFNLFGGLPDHLKHKDCPWCAKTMGGLS